MLAVAPSDHIIAELHRILETTPTQNDFPVGILTNEHRDTWYQARETLKQGGRGNGSRGRRWAGGWEQGEEVGGGTRYSGSSNDTI